MERRDEGWKDAEGEVACTVMAAGWKEGEWTEVLADAGVGVEGLQVELVGGWAREVRVRCPFRRTVAKMGTAPPCNRAMSRADWSPWGKSDM